MDCNEVFSGSVFRMIICIVIKVFCVDCVSNDRYQWCVFFGVIFVGVKIFVVQIVGDVGFFVFVVCVLILGFKWMCNYGVSFIVLVFCFVCCDIMGEFWNQVCVVVVVVIMVLSVVCKGVGRVLFCLVVWWSILVQVVVFKKYCRGIEFCFSICDKEYMIVLLGQVEILGVKNLLSDCFLGFIYIISVFLFFFWRLQFVIFFSEVCKKVFEGVVVCIEDIWDIFLDDDVGGGILFCLNGINCICELEE